MSTESPMKTKQEKSPQLIRYYTMIGLIIAACVFLVLAFMYASCTIPFTIAFAIAATGAIIFHAILNHVLKGYYTGVMFNKKAIDAQWEEANKKTEEAMEHNEEDAKDD